MVPRLHADGVGYSLQFCSVPVPFRVVKEADRSSREEIDFFLLVEIQDLLRKQVISVVPPHNREKRLYFADLLLPNKTECWRQREYLGVVLNSGPFCWNPDGSPSDIAEAAAGCRSNSPVVASGVRQE